MMSAIGPSSHRLRGFTMVELLVVIAIILVLGTLAFVGSRAALQRVNQASAISNLRQVGTGLLGLIGEASPLSENKIPNAFPSEAGFTSSGVRYHWMYEVAEYAGLGKHDGNGFGAQFVWYQDPNKTIFHDPTADWDIVDKGNPNDRGMDSAFMTAHFGYNLNLGEFTNPFHDGPNRERDRDYTMVQVKYPEDTILVAQAAASGNLSEIESSREGHVVTGSSMFIFPWRSLGAIATRINGGGYCMFVDGHIDLMLADRVYDGEWNKTTFIPDANTRLLDR